VQSRGLRTRSAIALNPITGTGKTVQVERLGRFVFVCITLKNSIFSITPASYASSTHRKRHKLGIFLIFMNLKFSIPIPLNRQYFISPIPL